MGSLVFGRVCDGFAHLQCSTREVWHSLSLLSFLFPPSLCSFFLSYGFFPCDLAVLSIFAPSYLLNKSHGQHTFKRRGHTLAYNQNSRVILQMNLAGVSLAILNNLPSVCSNLHPSLSQTAYCLQLIFSTLLIQLQH